MPMKLPQLNPDKMSAQELGRLKEELQSVTDQVERSLERREREHQFAVTNMSAVEFLANTEARFKEIGLYNSSVARFALLMLYEHRRTNGSEDPLTQDEPWCTSDYDVLRTYADMVVKSSLTCEAAVVLLAEQAKRK